VSGLWAMSQNGSSSMLSVYETGKERRVTECTEHARKPNLTNTHLWLMSDIDPDWLDTEPRARERIDVMVFSS
jgi:hypothetical protein